VGEIRGEEAYVFIQALATGHGGGCTFHGDSVESMVMRLTTAPINASPSFLPLISSVIISRMLKLPGRKPMRRVVEANEITGVTGPQSVASNKIFEWNVNDDKHYPLEPAEVVKRSRKLDKLRTMLGLTQDELTAELGRRRDFVDAMVKNGILEYEAVSKEIKKYYSGKVP
jgi:flagellar protein FlaI